MPWIKENSSGNHSFQTISSRFHQSQKPSKHRQTWLKHKHLTHIKSNPEEPLETCKFDHGHERVDDISSLEIFWIGQLSLKSIHDPIGDGTAFGHGRQSTWNAKQTVQNLESAAWSCSEVVNLPSVSNKKRLGSLVTEGNLTTWLAWDRICNEKFAPFFLWKESQRSAFLSLNLCIRNGILNSLFHFGNEGATRSTNYPLLLLGKRLQDFIFLDRILNTASSYACNVRWNAALALPIHS